MTTPPDWVNLLLADLVWERRTCGLAGFLCRTCCAAYRRARRRGGAGAAYWYTEAYRWCRADYDARRRRDGGCRGR